MLTLIASYMIFSATVYEATFDQANEAYQRGAYEEAIQAYEQLVAAQVVDPVLFYNLGTAYYRENRLGMAVLNYERALYLRPDFAAARDNLARVLRDTEQNLPRPETRGGINRLLGSARVAPQTLFRISAGCWLLFWAVLLVRLWKPLPYMRIGALLLLLVAGVTALGAYDRAQPSPLAVVVTERAPVRFGVNETEQERFALYEGDRVLYDRQEEDWLRVVTADGERGWVHQSQVRLVGPPFHTTVDVESKDRIEDSEDATANHYPLNKDPESAVNLAQR